MNSYINDVMQELNSLRANQQGSFYTVDQCLKIIEIASLKKLDNQLQGISSGLRAIGEISEQLGTIAEDQHDLREAIVREKITYAGDFIKYAYVVTSRED